MRLASRVFVPDDLGHEAGDGRRLGVAVVLRLGNAAPAEDAFVSGWHPPEPGSAWRWTDGDARLRVPAGAGPTLLRLTVVDCGARYWVRRAGPAVSRRSSSASSRRR